MKLVFAIVHDEDGPKVVHELNVNGFGVTKLATTGGFLRSGNTTLLVGVEASKLDDVIAIIESKSKSRKEIVATSIPQGSAAGMYMSYPMEIVVGGATVFVVDVERFEKV